MKFNYLSLKITGFLVFVFILQILFPQLTNLFVLESSDVFTRPWILITSIFLHGGLSHLLLNGFALALFGSILEQIIGSKRFLFVFFVSGIFASIFSSFFYDSALGASGAIFGVLGTLTVLRPLMTVWVSYMPMPMWVAAIVWALQDIFGIFIPDNIANFAHLGGLFLGLIIGFYLRRKPEKKVKTRRKKGDIMLTKDEIESWERGHFGV